MFDKEEALSELARERRRRVILLLQNSANGLPKQGIEDALEALSWLYRLSKMSSGHRKEPEDFKKAVNESARKEANTSLLSSYSQDCLGHAEQWDPGSFSEACWQRSMLQILLDEYLIYSSEDELPLFLRTYDLGFTDDALQEAALHVPPLPPKKIPSRVPSSHWWWNAPQGDPYHELDYADFDTDHSDSYSPGTPLRIYQRASAPRPPLSGRKVSLLIEQMGIVLAKLHGFSSKKGEIGRGFIDILEEIYILHLLEIAETPTKEERHYFEREVTRLASKGKNPGRLKQAVNENTARVRQRDHENLLHARKIRSHLEFFMDYLADQETLDMTVLRGLSSDINELDDALREETPALPLPRDAIPRWIPSSHWWWHTP
ncbi:hypothetical protein ACQEU5_07320 [Marinactinospora thermotolerans]|uniref:hypothetical protein n=1 Tax=Marinactinospora thermotolerans TaxID=531310 RepID=UPI003D920BE9